MNKTTRLGLGLMAVAGSATSVLQAVPAQANTTSGPGLDATRNITINAASTFNNSYGTSFEATGILGSTDTAAFAGQTTAGNLNSGTAYLSAMVSFDAGSAGVTSAISGLSSALAPTASTTFINQATSAIAISGTQQTFGSVNPVGIILAGGTGGSSSITVGGSFIGTNIGTEALQVGGGLQEVITNQLSAF